jgi:hypothetical protein
MSLMPFLFTGSAALSPASFNDMRATLHARSTTQKKALLRQRLLQNR